MNDVQQLIDAVHQTGATLRAEPPNLVLGSPERVPAELKARLREHKTEILRRLEMERRLRRLEMTDILVAISDKGDFRIVQTDAHAHQAVIDGFTIYSPRDAYMYVNLSDQERRMLQQFKRRFSGTTEWK